MILLLYQLSYAAAKGLQARADGLCLLVCRFTTRNAVGDPLQHTGPEMIPDRCTAQIADQPTRTARLGASLPP